MDVFLLNARKLEYEFEPKNRFFYYFCTVSQGLLAQLV